MPTASVTPVITHIESLAHHTAAMTSPAAISTIAGARSPGVTASRRYRQPPRTYSPATTMQPTTTTGSMRPIVVG